MAENDDAMAQGDDSGTWLPICAAADETGLARRTLFRWAASALIPVRDIGSRRLVELGAVREFAAGRRKTSAIASQLAANWATPTTEEAALASPPPVDPVDGGGVEALRADIILLQQWQRYFEQCLTRIEQRLALPPP